ncbi:MAG: HIT family protein [Geminicoccaceae bacterium]
MNPFSIDPRLLDGSDALLDWPLCHVRLKDDARWHWLLLVPRIHGLRDYGDLDDASHARLMRETREADRLLAEIARPFKRNVAMIGNVVAQMHIHVVGRNEDDAAWPQPVWCAGPGAPRAPDEQQRLCEEYRTRLRAVDFTV